MTKIVLVFNPYFEFFKSDSSMSKPSYSLQRNKKTESSTTLKKEVESPVSVTELMSTTQEHLQEKAVLVSSSEEVTGVSMSSDNSFNYDAWFIKHLEADRGDGWCYGVCPKCHPGKETRGATPTLMLHLTDGYFFCHVCGHHGDVSKSPGSYQAKHITFNKPWWKVLTREEAENVLFASKNLPENFIFPEEMEVFQDFTFINDSAGNLIQINSLFFPCRKSADSEIQTLISIPFDDDYTFAHPKGMRGTPALPLGWDSIKIDENQDKITFVAHPLEKLVLEQASITNVVCLNPRSNPNQADNGDWNFLGLFENTLNKTHRFIMAMGPDKNNEAISNYLARRLGKDRCLRVRWSSYALRTGQSPNAYEMLHEYSSEDLYSAVINAPAFPISGIREALDISDEIDVLYELGIQPGVKTGYPSLDEYYSVAKSESTLIAGIPGHGKTTTADNFIIQLAKLHGWKSGVYSPEKKNEAKIFAGFIEKYIQHSFGSASGEYQKMSVADKENGKLWVHEHIKVILPRRQKIEQNEEDDTGSSKMGVDWLIEKARALVLRHGIRILVVDPWDELDHERPSYMSETEFLSQELKKLLHFTALYELHLFITHHPNKMTKANDGDYPVVNPYMLNNGAVWRSKMDNIISPYRFVGDKDEEITDLHIQKIREIEVGKVGKLSLRLEKNGSYFVDDVNQEKRKESLNKPKEQKYSTEQLRGKERVYTKGSEHRPIKQKMDSPF